MKSYLRFRFQIDYSFKCALHFIFQDIEFYIEPLRPNLIRILNKILFAILATDNTATTRINIKNTVQCYPYLTVEVQRFCGLNLTFFIVVSKLSIASFILSSSVRLASWMFVVMLELLIGLKLLCPKNDFWHLFWQFIFERIPFEQFEAWCMNNFLIFFNCIFQFFKFCFNFKLNFSIFNIFLSKRSLQLLLWLFRYPSD